MRYPEEYIRLCHRYALLDLLYSTLDALLPEGDVARPELFSPHLPAMHGQVEREALLDELSTLRDRIEEVQTQMERYEIRHEVSEKGACPQGEGSDG